MYRREDRGFWSHADWKNNTAVWSSGKICMFVKLFLAITRSIFRPYFLTPVQTLNIYPYRDSAKYLSVEGGAWGAGSLQSHINHRRDVRGDDFACFSRKLFFLQERYPSCSTVEQVIGSPPSPTKLPGIFLKFEMRFLGPLNETCLFFLSLSRSKSNS